MRRLRRTFVITAMIAVAVMAMSGLGSFMVSGVRDDVTRDSSGAAEP